MDALRLLEYRINARRDIDQLKREQNQKLMKIIGHAYRTVPFYIKKFRELGLNPSDIRSVQDLHKLPIITKKDILENPEMFYSSAVNKKDCKINRTSGSTGMFLEILLDKDAISNENAVNYRALFENGLSPFDKTVEITHPKNFPGRDAFFQRMGVLRKQRLSIFDKPEQMIQKLNRWAPQVLIGYPSTLAELAAYSDDNSIPLPKLKKIFTTSELLSPGTREKITKNFGCDVIDLYGSTEFRRVAWECKSHLGYHQDMDFVVAEIGPQGNLILTGLENHAMPLIRYQIGDIAEATDKSCTCGINLPLLKSIHGRQDDQIILPSGRVISPRRINVLDYIEGIKKYKIIQKSRKMIVIEYVKGKGYDQTTRRRMVAEVKKGLLGEEVEIELVPVLDIKPDKSGKLRTIVSEVRE